MKYFLVKNEFGPVLIGSQPPDPDGTSGGSYSRPLREDEVVDGIVVSDWPEGMHEIKQFPPEPTPPE